MNGFIFEISSQPWVYGGDKGIFGPYVYTHIKFSKIDSNIQQLVDILY